MKQHYNLFFLHQNNQMDTLYLNLLFLLSCLVLKEVKMSGLHSSKRASVNERGGGGGGGVIKVVHSSSFANSTGM